MENGLRIVCISDTHSKHLNLKLPLGDILIHSGDFTSTGTKQQIDNFINWFNNQRQYKYKIFISGNHDITLDKKYYIDRGSERFHSKVIQQKENYADECRYLLNNNDCIYLEDNQRNIEFIDQDNNIQENISIYGSPWQPEFCDWAFNAKRGDELKQIWSNIPGNLDILITHGPPLGLGDLTEDGFRCGCSDLLDVILNRPPRVHIFGHIHEAYGSFRREDLNTLFVNASTCNYHYRPNNEPIVVFLPFNKSSPAYIIPPEYPPEPSTESKSDQVR